MELVDDAGDADDKLRERQRVKLETSLRERKKKEVVAKNIMITRQAKAARIRDEIAAERESEKAATMKKVLARQRLEQQVAEERKEAQKNGTRKRGRPPQGPREKELRALEKKERDEAKKAKQMEERFWFRERGGNMSTLRGTATDVVDGHTVSTWQAHGATNALSLTQSFDSSLSKRPDSDDDAV